MDGGHHGHGVVIPYIAPAGLGDRAAKILASIGVTKDLAQAVAKAVGLQDCGCSWRQERLNELGRMLGIGVANDLTPRLKEDAHPPVS